MRSATPSRSFPARRTNTRGCRPARCATASSLEADTHGAIVASTSDVALYQEHGTATVPPRPFLAPIAAIHAEDAADAIGAAVAKAIEG